MHRAARTDKNQKEIVNVFRKCGAYVIHLHQIKNAFDLLVAYRGNLLAVEVKDGSKPPSAQKLTPGEIECKTNLEKNGVKYNVVKSIDEAINLLNKY